MFFDRFRKKKEETPIPLPTNPSLPTDLERFRVEREASFERPIETFDVPKERLPEPRNSLDRTELIIQKLDTIDARLRFIEEKLKRF